MSASETTPFLVANAPQTSQTWTVKAFMDTLACTEKAQNGRFVIDANGLIAIFGNISPDGKVVTVLIAEDDTTGGLKWIQKRDVNPAVLRVLNYSGEACTNPYNESVEELRTMSPENETTLRFLGSHFPRDKVFGHSIYFKSLPMRVRQNIIVQNSALFPGRMKLNETSFFELVSKRVLTGPDQKNPIYLDACFYIQAARKNEKGATPSLLEVQKAVESGRAQGFGLLGFNGLKRVVHWKEANSKWRIESADWKDSFLIIRTEDLRVSDLPILVPCLDETPDDKTIRLEQLGPRPLRYPLQPRGTFTGS